MTTPPPQRIGGRCRPNGTTTTASWRWGGLVGGLAVAAGLAGCGDDGPDAASEAAAGVAAVIAERVDVPVEDVEVVCPEDLEVAAGISFSCEVAVAGGEAVAIPLKVAADGTIELERAVIPTDAAEAYLTGQLTGPAEAPVATDCGDAALLVAAVGDELRCTAIRTSDGSTHAVVVTVVALDGTVRYRVEPATGS